MSSVSSGWRGLGKNTIKWDGTIEADNFKGDGSNLSNLNYLKLDGSNANQDIDIGDNRFKSEGITTAGGANLFYENSDTDVAGGIIKNSFTDGDPYLILGHQTLDIEGSPILQNYFLFQYDYSNQLLTLDKFGGAGTFKIDMETDLNSHKIINLTDPTNDQDAATKNYVDDNVFSGNSSDLTWDENVDLGSNDLTTTGTGKFDDIGIGVSPSYPIDIVDDTNYLQLRLSHADGNGLKIGGIAFRHFTESEEDISGIVATSDNSNNRILYGGGDSHFNSATKHSFYAGATDTTKTGTEIVTINSEGMDLNSNKIVNVIDPTNDQDAATKNYVDDNVFSGNSSDLTWDENVDLGSHDLTAEEVHLAKGDLSYDLKWDGDYPGIFGDYGDFFLGITNDPKTYINYYNGEEVDFGMNTNKQDVRIFGTLEITDSADIPKLSNLGNNGFVKTSGGDGTVSVDTTDYAESSDLDSYVPYTGATGNVDLGSNDLTTAGNISLEAGSGNYYSNDGSQGWTGNFTNGDGNTVTVKNGIITNVS